MSLHTTTNMNTALQSSPLPQRICVTSFLADNYRGVLLSLTIALCAVALTAHPILQSIGLNPILVAMLSGILIGNLLGEAHQAAFEKGLTFTKHKLLRLGIILFGFRLTFADLGVVGLDGLLIDACVLFSTLILAYFLGKWVFKLEQGAFLIVGAGSAICGAAAILATAPVVKAKPEHVSVAVASVVLFGTCATLLYPFLYQLNLDWKILPATHHAFGIYIGSTIHEVAQVAAAGSIIDAGVAGTAVIEKLARVMLLPAFLVSLSMFCTDSADGKNLDLSKTEGSRLSRMISLGRKAVPWFVVWFCVALAVNTLTEIPLAPKRWLTESGTLFLTMAMAALGMGTRLSAFNRGCYKLLALAAILFLWLVIGGAAINYCFS